MRKDGYASIITVKAREKQCKHCKAIIKDQDINWIPGPYDNTGWKYLDDLHGYTEEIKRRDSIDKVKNHCPWVIERQQRECWR